MILCPTCTGKSHVVESRKVGDTIRRRRECMSCKARWTTVEISIDKVVDQTAISAAMSALQKVKE